MRTIKMVKPILLLSICCSFGACKNVQNDPPTEKEAIAPIQKEIVKPKKVVKRTCEVQGLPVYPLYPNALQKTLSFSASRIDVKDWLSNFDDSQITDNERKYLELLTTYDTSAELSYHKGLF